ncbi:MAG: transposase [Sphingomonadaceae bacterium]
MRQAGLFGLSDHLKRLSAYGDPLEELCRIIDFEAFRPTLAAALAYGDGSKGGRPPYDLVAMLKVLVLAAQNNVSDARMEYLIRDRLRWLRFLGFDLGATTPDANTIRLFREKLTEVGALDTLFADFDRQLKERGYLAMGGHELAWRDATDARVRNVLKTLLMPEPMSTDAGVLRSKSEARG